MSNASLAVTGGSTAFCPASSLRPCFQDLTGKGVVMKTAAMKPAVLKPELNQIVFLALAAAFIFSISSARADDTPVGKVRAIYVEAGRGVLMELPVGKASQSANRWADVDLGAHTTNSRRIVTVQLPVELKVEQGDLVEVALASNSAAGNISLAPLASISRATLVSAKWFTPQADAFDGSPLASASRLRAASSIF
jgi:hypothetical protein